MEDRYAYEIGIKIYQYAQLHPKKFLTLDDFYENGKFYLPQRVN